MSRAKKLLEKTKKIKDKVNRNFKQRYQLSEYPGVFNIIASKKSSSLRSEVKKKQETVEIVKEIEEFSCNSIALMRIDFDFPNEDYGLELVVPSGIITASGIGSCCEVAILEGALEGRSLEVIEVKDLNTLRLDDVSTFNQPEEEVKVRFIL